MVDHDDQSPMSLSNAHTSSRDKSRMNLGVIRNPYYYPEGTPLVAGGDPTAETPTPTDGSYFPVSAASTPSPAQSSITPAGDPKNPEVWKDDRWRRLSRSRIFDARWKRSLVFAMVLTIKAAVIIFPILDALHILPHRPTNTPAPTPVNGISPNTTTNTTPKTTDVQTLNVTSTNATEILTADGKRWRKVNCYKDGKWQSENATAPLVRALTPKFVSREEMTLEMCATECAEYKYFGVENSVQCLCGDEINPHAVVYPDAACNMPCGGNGTQTCGAAWKLWIYEQE
ncbi:hypothetical protein IFR05_014448 [Cadophora sp. M221]|nr:hypothetical protein IFR05_014448 [Cadophora sp. M221]